MIINRATLLLCLGLTTVMCCWGCRNESNVELPSSAIETEVAPWFVERTGVAGIDFVHSIGDPTLYEARQIHSGGGGLVDYDRDGWLDLYLVNHVPEDAFYRQVSPLSFQDVTDLTRVAGAVNGLGISAGDYDQDGFPDLLLHSSDSVRLWANNGDGTFDDVTDQAGIRLNGFAVAAVFGDYNLDGQLDLFVVNYVDFIPGLWCEDATGRREFCGPAPHQGTVDRLFRNRGEAGPGLVTFEEVTTRTGFTSNPGKGLGVVFGDLTGDGLPDYYVANDLEPNHFWEQLPDGTFQDIAMLNGTAFNQFGEAEAGMGVVAADLANDGNLQLFVTHLTGQTNTLYVPVKKGVFQDLTLTSGLGPPSHPYTGFGVGTLDIEHDGDLDLIIANGRIKRGSVIPGASSGELSAEYAEPNQLFLNEGGLSFRVADAEAGAFSRQIEVSRSLVLGDIDNDGDVDFVVTNLGGPARLFLNEAPKSGHWLQVRLIGRDSDRDAIGADIYVILAESSLRGRVSPTAGYLAFHDPRVHFGLGDVDLVEQIVVRWPRGTWEAFPETAPNQEVVLQQGRGSPVTGIFWKEPQP